MSNIEKRVKRYHDKIEFIIEKIEDIPKDNPTSLEKDGIFYRLLVAIEAAMDIIAMQLKDIGIKVEDDYNNIEKLVTNKRISIELGKGLKKCNGLRNILVHKYNKMDEEIAIESIDEVKRNLISLIKIIEEFLDEFKKNKG